MSTLSILALTALGILALFTAIAIANTGRRQHHGSGLGADDSGYVPGAWDAAGHSSCDSGSSGDSGGGDCGGH